MSREEEEQLRLRWRQEEDAAWERAMEEARWEQAMRESEDPTKEV